jgi:hypothetical protein
MRLPWAGLGGNGRQQEQENRAGEGRSVPMKGLTEPSG